MTSLPAGTTIHVRAYAINSVGTNYGTNLSFTTLPPAPTVTSISPNTGSTAGGTDVLITGSNFTGVTGVTFGGVPVLSFSVISTIQISCTTPAGTVGAKSVIVTTAGGSNAANTLFTYVVPTVTGITPATGSTPSSADHTDFGNALVAGGTVVRTFTITNLGTADLTLDGVSVTGTNAAEFFASAPGTNTLAPQTSTTLSVTFSPAASGPKTATLTLTNNDGDESVFTFALAGFGNRAPVAVDHCDGAISGTSAVIPVVKILAGSSDADGDTLTLASVSATTTNGTVSITGTNVTYTPTGGFFGTDAFTYTLSDGRNGTATATVTMNVLDATLPLLNRLEMTSVSNAPLVRFIGLPCHDYTLLRSLGPQGPFVPLVTITAPASGLIEHRDPTPLTNIVTVSCYTRTNGLTYCSTNIHRAVFFRMSTQP